MTNGFEIFKSYIKDYKEMCTLALSGFIAIPVAAKIFSISPPWPTGIIIMTSFTELIALIIVFHFLGSASKKRISKKMTISLIVLTLCILLYLIVFSQFTYIIPTTNEYSVKGFVPTQEAYLVFNDKCPWLGLDELRMAEYNAERLWTPQSITTIRILLVFLWLIVFFNLSVFISGFILSLMKYKTKIK